MTPPAAWSSRYSKSMPAFFCRCCCNVALLSEIVDSLDPDPKLVLRRSAIDSGDDFWLAK